MSEQSEQGQPQRDSNMHATTEEQMRNSLDKDPNNADLHYKYALALLKRHRKEEKTDYDMPFDNKFGLVNPNRDQCHNLVIKHFNTSIDLITKSNDEEQRLTKLLSYLTTYLNVILHEIGKICETSNDAQLETKNCVCSISNDYCK